MTTHGKQHRTQGYSLLELSIAIPPLILLLLGSLDVVHYFRTYYALDQALQEGLRCLSGTESCSRKNPPPIPLFSIDIVDSEQEALLPTYTVEGSAEGFAETYLIPTGFRARYLNEATFTDETSLQLFEKTYQLQAQGELDVLQQIQLGRNAQGYTTRNADTYSISLPEGTQVSDTSSVIINTRTPERPFGTTCISSLQPEGVPCDRAAGHMLLLAEGIGIGGTTGESNIVQITIGGKRMGGREFLSPGLNNQVDADFAPRGSFHVSSFAGDPGWQETKRYRTNRLPYNTPVQIKFEHRQGSALWRVTKLTWVLPRYRTMSLDSPCNNPVSKSEFEDTPECHLSTVRAQRLYNALDKLGKLNLGISGEATGRALGTVACDYQNSTEEQYTIPKECTQKRQTISCPRTIEIPGAKNVGLSPELTPGTTEWIAAASELCPVPSTATEVRWTTADYRYTPEESPDFFTEKTLVQDCSNLDAMKIELVPTELKAFRDISISTTLQPSENLYKNQPDHSINKDYTTTCMKSVTLDLQQLVSPESPEHVLHSGCGFPDNIQSQLGLPSSVKLHLKARPTGMYKAVSVLKDTCQQEHAAYQMTTKGSIPAPVPALPLSEAESYCKSHNLICKFTFQGYESHVKDITTGFDLAASETRASNLFASFSNVRKAEFTANVSTQNQNNTAVATLTGSATFTPVLNKLLGRTEPTTIAISRQTTSHRSLLGY